MVKRWLSLVLVLVVLTAAISCAGGGGGGGSPSAIVKNYYTAINSGSFDKAEECLIPGQKIPEDFRELVGKIEKTEILDEQIGEAFGVKIAEVIVEVTLAPAAESQMWLSLFGGTKHVLLEKRKAGWRIEFIQ